MKSCDPRDSRVASMSTTKVAIKTWTPDLGQLSHKNTRRITQVASRSGVDKNRNISSAAVGMNPTPPSSNVSGQAPRHGGPPCAGVEAFFNRASRRRRIHLRSVCDPGLLSPGKNPVMRSVAMTVRGVASMRKARKGMGGVNGDPDAWGVDGEG